MINRVTVLSSAIRVLIEGPDLVGKSTIASALADHLRNSYCHVDHISGKFSEKSWNRVLRRLDANRLSQSNTLNSLYIASAVLDRFLLPSAPPSAVVLCESYVDRAIAYGIAIRQNPFAHLALRLPRLFPSFKLAVLLTCSYETRLARLAARPVPTRIDRVTCESRATHDRFVAAYRLALARHTNLLHFDTGTVSVEQIVRRIAYEVAQLASPSQTP